MAMTLKALRERGKKRCKQSLVAVPFFFTFANALLGFFSILNAIEGSYTVAASCILLAVLMDACDGRTARALGVTSPLGMELDSLCDAVSFCLAPAILFYQWSLHQLGMWGVAILGVYVCAGLFRLAQFNVIHGEHDDVFIGLPTPAGAALFAVIYLNRSWLVPMPWVLAVVVGIVAVLMVSRIAFPASKKSSIL